ncbi:MAG: hypothetical protein LJE61_02760 [Thiocapsa sp.]|jgi:hypothetical protein|nr:hypothetical protein [Thiocapsa sp.]MCG6896834.1 hypothetical protein [Thiocapsa sp.]MCG6984110.1 hypothetical protein [Thiocapsa sp.]
MKQTLTSDSGLTRRLWTALTKFWVARVPDDLSCCEFDCRRTRCSVAEWERCPARLEVLHDLEAERSREQC